MPSPVWSISLPALDAFIEQLPPGTDLDRLTEARAAAIEAFRAKEDDKFTWIMEVIHLRVFAHQTVPGARFKARLDARLREQAQDAAIERRMRGAHPWEPAELATWKAMTASIPFKTDRARHIIRAFGLPSHWFDTLRKLL